MEYSAAKGEKKSDLAELKKLYEQAKSPRQRFESEWYLNLAYYTGNQWSVWQRGRLVRPTPESGRVLFTDNRIIGIVRTEVAKMTKNRPTFVAVPTTSGDADINAARMAERILEYVWVQEELAKKQRAVLLWSRICGAGFWKVYWDANKGQGEDFLAGPDGQILMDQRGRPMRYEQVQDLSPEAMQPGLQKRTISQGDVCVEVRSPFELYPDPLAGEEGITDAEWVVEETVQSREYIRSRYDKDMEPDTDAIAGLTESRSLLGDGSAGSSAYKGIKVHEYWCKPCSQHPKGKRAVWTKNEVLYEGDAPDGLPYVMFSGLVVPGRFWPSSIVTQLRPVQTELNKTRSQIRENASRLGNPAFISSRLAHVKYQGLPGEHIEFDPTTQDAKPDYLRPPEMPSYVQNELDRSEQSLREISGQHEVTQGQVPGGVTAASAINLLQEQDDTRLSNDIYDMELAMGKAGDMIVKLIAENYAEDRTIRIAGEDEAWEIFDFKGSQLKGHDHVECQAGSAMPRSKAAKQAAMQEMFDKVLQYGVQVKPRDIRKFFRDFEVGGLETLFGQLDLDERQIQREHLRMIEQGQVVEINSYDDDEAHIAGHQEFCKTARYESLPDEIQQVLLQHTLLHEQRMAQKQAAQMQVMGMQQDMMAPPQPPNGRGTLPNSKSGGASGNSK